jgi:hypothetical protein
MKKEDIKGNILKMTKSLLEMARNSCWNTISDDCLYILSSNCDEFDLNFIELRKYKKQINDKKLPRKLEDILPELALIYKDIYEIDLYVFHARKNDTIIEIEYILKLPIQDENNYLNSNLPQLHCKLAIPFYLNKSNDKFDINWELGGWRHQWFLFWHKIKLRTIQIVR